jgi:hypothetical protein
LHLERRSFHAVVVLDGLSDNPKNCVRLAGRLIPESWEIQLEHVSDDGLTTVQTSAQVDRNLASGD